MRTSVAVQSFFAALLSTASAIASAEVCCPAGCVQDGARCVTTGAAPRSCPLATCAPGQGGGAGKPPGGGSGGSGAAGGVTGGGASSGLTCRAPVGDFVNSCTSVSGDCASVAASCRTRGGRSVSTRIDLSRCASHRARNFDGVLRCDTRTFNPGGSYGDSCRDVWVEASTVHAQCRRSNGSWSVTSLPGFPTCRKGLENLDGRLACIQ